MKILVCVKQVPEATEVRVNPDTGTLNRDGVASILNPFCEYALDLALDVKAKLPGTEIAVLTMGPPQARMALLRCLEMGADRAILVTDRRFAGADTWATALTIAKIAGKLEGIDLILVGKHAIDGDTAQVGPMLAEVLNIPQITYAVGLDVEETAKAKRVKVRRENEGGYETVQMRLPGLVSVSRGAASRQVCSFQAILDARAKEIRTMTADDLGLSEAELGLKGSLTQVVKVFPPTVKAPGRIVNGADAPKAAREVVSLLQEKHFV